MFCLQRVNMKRPEENLSSTYQALGVLLHEPQNARLQSWRPQLMVLQTVVRRLT